MAHLEFLPPSVKVAVQYMDFSEKGITTITCLNTHRDFRLYNAPEYWNKDLKNDFMKRVTRLWDESYYKEGVGRQNMETESSFNA